MENNELSSTIRRIDGGFVMKSFFDLQKNSAVQWPLFLILIAIELLMSFSFLGYFHVEPISITFAYIPVLLAGCLLGPGASAALGCVFGLASMWKASAPYVAAGDRIFSPILSGEPISSLLLSVGSRLLFGLVIGILYFLAKRAKRGTFFWIGAVSFFGRTIHAFFVYGIMGLLFPQMGFHAFSAFSDILSPSGLATSFAAMLIVLVIYKLWNSAFFLRFQKRMQAVQNLHLTAHRSFLPGFIIAILTLSCSCAIALYFLQRMVYVLKVGGYSLSQTANYNLFHLQIQFLLGILSLVFLVSLFLLFVQRYTSYMRHEAKSDALTDVLNRHGFFPLCEHMLKTSAFQREGSGYFLILDIDYFKQVNDSLGHPKGDEILYKVAQGLRNIFSDSGIIGRLGGDEFAVLLYPPVSRERLEEKLSQFLETVRQIPCDGQNLSCSIGAVQVGTIRDIDELYRTADHYLYLAKNRGRDQFFIGEAGAVPAEGIACL